LGGENFTPHAFFCFHPMRGDPGFLPPLVKLYSPPLMSVGFTTPPLTTLLAVSEPPRPLSSRRSRFFELLFFFFPENLKIESLTVSHPLSVCILPRGLRSKFLFSRPSPALGSGHPRSWASPKFRKDLLSRTCEGRRQSWFDSIPTLWIEGFFFFFFLFFFYFFFFFWFLCFWRRARLTPLPPLSELDRTSIIFLFPSVPVFISPYFSPSFFAHILSFLLFFFFSGYALEGVEFLGLSVFGTVPPQGPGAMRRSSPAQRVECVPVLSRPVKSPPLLFGFPSRNVEVKSLASSFDRVAQYDCAFHSSVVCPRVFPVEAMIHAALLTFRRPPPDLAFACFLFFPRVQTTVVFSHVRLGPPPSIVLYWSGGLRTLGTLGKACATPP